MECCPSCGAATARWVRQKPVPPAARWVSSYITLRPYRCEACGWHGWRPPVPMARNTEVDDPLRLFPSEQPLRLPTPSPSAPPARRLVAARNETIVSRLRRSGRAASVALHAALRRGLVPEMLGLLVIGLLAGNLADRERAPAASLSSPLIQSAGTGTLSTAVASPTPAHGSMPPAPARAQPSIHHAAARVTPLAASAPRPPEPRPRNAESLKLAVTASTASRPRPQASAAIATNGTSAQTTAPPPGPRFRGHLVIESVPEGARVFVNQQAVGSTPIELPNLPAGSRAVRVEADGYELWSASVRVVAQQRTRVTANLQPSRN